MPDPARHLTRQIRRARALIWLTQRLIRNHPHGDHTMATIKERLDAVNTTLAPVAAGITSALDQSGLDGSMTTLETNAKAIVDALNPPSEETEAEPEKTGDAEVDPNAPV